ncbi:MAG: response regulator [Flavobacterium sp.]|nr:response regulator [Flavobacterium sp.]
MFQKLLKLYLLLGVSLLVSGQESASQLSIQELNDRAEKYLTELKFKESLLFAREALKRAIDAKSDIQISTAYNTIAGNYDELSEQDKAVDNYRKALQYAERADNDTLVGILNNNLGNMLFFEKKEYSAGINYYKKSLHYANKIADTSRLVFTHLNLTLAFFEIQQYEKGAPHLEFINEHFEEYGDPENRVYLNMLNGMYQGDLNNMNSATDYFETAILLAKENNQPLDLMYVYQEYARFLNKTGQHKAGFKYFETYDRLKDSIYDVDILKKAQVEGVNFELDEYKRALDTLETEKEVQALSLQKSYIIVILFIVVALVMALLLYITTKSHNFRKKSLADLSLANEQLILAKERAEEASQLKTQFVSTISHELRTPLYGVVGITNMILDEHPELADSPHLTSLKFSAKYLLSLVNDILQINKIEENRLVLENLIFNVTDEINTVKNSLQFIANRNKNVIITEIDTDIPEFMIGDKLRLSQIFMNLISNALKFTHAGEVKISAELVDTVGLQYYILFKISDTGIGIAPEDQAKVFDKFVQIERKEDDYQGTGLGLAIVSRLIQLFGSEIQLESAAGVGTTFSFIIAFEHNPAKAEQIINDIEVDLTSSQIFDILVVEDNKINQIVTKKILEKNNYKCSVVDDGLAAIQLLEKQTFDVILMDINMPVINGFETTRRIRELGITTPVVALTAFDKEEVTEEAISAGMNDIIIKPFEPIKLFQVLNGQILKKSAD